VEGIFDLFLISTWIAILLMASHFEKLVQADEADEGGVLKDCV
jgi:hypothetical protein